MKDTQTMLFAKIKDLCTISQKRPGFLGFLNENEVAAAEDFLHHRTETYKFWGGHCDAERKILGLFPDYISPQEELFPLKALSLYYREQDILTHRDFLGVFMSLGIERSTIGDILIEDGRCVVFVREEIQKYLQDNLRKIGSVGVRIDEDAGLPLPPMHMYKDCQGVIASRRLDCITAFLSKSSREKSAVMIKNGLVMKNHREILSPSEAIEEGDILSIKQKGKFLIDQLGPLTSKGRVVVRCRKYI